MDTPQSWMVEAVNSPYDLDNIHLAEVFRSFILSNSSYCKASQSNETLAKREKERRREREREKERKREREKERKREREKERRREREKERKRESMESGKTILQLVSNLFRKILHWKPYFIPLIHSRSLYAFISTSLSSSLSPFLLFSLSPFLPSSLPPCLFYYHSLYFIRGSTKHCPDSPFRQNMLSTM